MAEPDFTFTVDVLGWDPETRRVWGCASEPVPDRENEIIEAPALAEALPDFLALPVLLWDHTDRPIGLTPKAWFEGDRFFIDGNLKPTSDCDDISARADARKVPVLDRRSPAPGLPLLPPPPGGQDRALPDHGPRALLGLSLSARNRAEPDDVRGDPQGPLQEIGDPHA
jgi:hypothetical protein